MSKDTPCSSDSPELFAYPANLPFAMGFPFPAIPPPLGHFIPIGMAPINGITLQNYMDLTSKNGLHPAMIAPMFGPSAIAPLNILSNQNGDKIENGYCGNISQKGMDETQSSSVRTHDITKSTSSSNVYSMGSDDNPVVPLPSVFLLPFSPGGMAGYFPHYPPFCAMPSKREDFQPKDSKLLDNLSEQGVISLNMPEERKDSDELDVARILVDMQVPVLKQIQTSNTKLSLPNIKVTNDLNAVKNTCNENTSSMDGILTTASFNSAPLEVLSSKTHHNSYEETLKDTPLVFQHGSEKSDKHLETPDLNNVVIALVDRQSSENTEEKEVKELNLNDQVRPEEMHLEENKEDDPIDVKLEVISEGESIKPVSIQPVDNTDHEQLLPELGSNEAKVMPIDMCKEENLQQLASIRSDEVNVYSVKTPVALASKANTKSLSDALTTSYSCKQQIIPGFEDKNVLKQESPEEMKDQSDTEKDINFGSFDDHSSDENGLSKKHYKCGVCSQLFRSPLGLQKHIEFHMDDGKHYTCTICFMNFSDDTALQEHHEKHTRKRPHKCKFCPKAFRDPGSLQKHVRVHTGEKPYKCKDCSGSFAEYSSLRKHQRVHTGEQPYKCKYCSKAFSISGNLQRHILIHTGERPYKCNFCTKAFNNPSHLRRHVKNLHFRDAEIDEAMLSHYGNPTKTNDNDSSPGPNEEETIKTKIQPINDAVTSGSNPPNISSLEIAPGQMIINNI